MHDLAAEPFVGFRIFRVTPDGMLTSLTGRGFGLQTLWMPGQIMESTCSHAVAHGPIAPAFECTCGIWAVKSRRDLQRAYPNLAHQALNYHKEQRAAARRKQATTDDLKMFLQGHQVNLPGLGTPNAPWSLQFIPKLRGPRIPDHRRMDFASARVHLWGVVHEHQRGYRAQFAEIIPETIRWWPRQGAWFKPKLLQHIIDKYTVEEGGETDEPDYLSG